MTIDEFAPQISFFFYTHGDFFEEIAKYRAGRRRWATIVRERYGAKTDKASMFRFGCVSGGASLYAPQAQNNLVRVAYEAMAVGARRRAVDVHRRLGRAVRAAQRGVGDAGAAHPADPGLRDRRRPVADPLGGSYFVEALTDATEERIIEIMADLENHGGMVRCIEDGYLQGLIADEAYKIHREVESGERPVVGVNKFVSDEPPPDIATYELDAEGRELQLKRLARVKAERDCGRCGEQARRPFARGRRYRQPDAALIDCANAYCTVGEMVSTLKAVWGEFQQPVVF